MQKIQQNEHTCLATRTRTHNVSIFETYNLHRRLLLDVFASEVTWPREMTLLISVIELKTRMHSSRMLTGRSLTVSRGGGASFLWGRGWGVWSWGRASFLWGSGLVWGGASFWGGLLLGGCLLLVGGGHPSMHWLPPRGQNNRHE